MSFTSTVDQINAETVKYAPAILQGVLDVEAAAAGLPGQTKQQLIVDTIAAGAAAAQAVPVPQVQGIAALISIFVAILNAAGIFKRKAAAARQDNSSPQPPPPPPNVPYKKGA